MQYPIEEFKKALEKARRQACRGETINEIMGPQVLRYGNADLHECQRWKNQRVFCSNIRVEQNLPMKMRAEYPPHIAVEMAGETIRTYERSK